MKTVKSDEARSNFRALIDEVKATGEPVLVLAYGIHPAVVLVSPEWFERAREALGENDKGDMT